MENNKQDTAVAAPVAPALKSADKSDRKVENKQKSKIRPTGPSSKWPMRLGLLVSLLIALMALAACYWLYTQTLMLKTSLDTNQNSMQNSIQNSVQIANISLNNSLQEAKTKISELEQLQQKNKNTYQTLEELKKAQEQQHAQLAALSKRSPNHWMASEADYLTRMAGRKLWLEADTKTAILLLQAADERISAMENPALLPIRQALSQDIVALQSVKNVDISSSILAIDAIISKLDALPLNANKTLSTPQVTDNLALSDNLNDWQSNLTKSWQAFTSSLVTIRKRTTDIEPLLAPEQQWYLIENIRNKLAQAQAALHQADNKSYHQALGFAAKWLTQYFDRQASSTQDVIDSLQKLNELQISPIIHQQLQAAPMLEQLVTYGELSPTVETSL
jgi:uroporphyrin-3 C-methyltransferase